MPFARVRPSPLRREAVSRLSLDEGSGAGMRRHEHRSDVFMQPSGAGVIVRQHGLIEDAKIWSELAVHRAFHTWRRAVRWAFGLPPPPAWVPGGLDMDGASAGETLEAAQKAGASEVWGDMDVSSLGKASQAAPSTGDAGRADEGRVSSRGTRPRSAEKGATWRQWWWSRLGGNSKGNCAAWDYTRHQSHPLRGKGMPRSHSMFDTRRAVSLPASPTTHRTFQEDGSFPSEGANCSTQTNPSDEQPTASGSGAARAGAPLGIRRANSFSRKENVVQHISEVSCASDVIRLSGYPLEEHTVSDGWGNCHLYLNCGWIGWKCTAISFIYLNLTREH